MFTKISILTYSDTVHRSHLFFFFLTPSTLGKIFSRQHIEIFFLFFPGNIIEHFMQTVSNGDNLHEMSNPVFWKNKKNFIHLSSADFASRGVKVNYIQISSI